MCKCISLLGLKKFVVVVVVVVTAIKLGWADLRSPGIYISFRFFSEPAAEFRLGFAFRSMLDRIS